MGSHILVLSLRRQSTVFTSNIEKKLRMSSIQTVSPGVAQSGVADQYADGTAAKVWHLHIGEHMARTTNYKNFLVKLLKDKKAYTILDAACGTGVDSVMLLNEMGNIPAFSLTSSDYSDKMLKEAYKVSGTEEESKPSSTGRLRK